jgi:hypothetical protein
MDEDEDHSVLRKRRYRLDSKHSKDPPSSSLDTDKLYRRLIFVLIPIIIAIGGIYLIRLYITSPPKACDLTDVLSRDFDHYYGLINLDNPLSNLNAEQGASINSRCDLFYDHMRLFPAGNLPLSKSMIIQALRGSGKTQMRQCIINRISRNNLILINMYGADINNYLENFVTNIDIVPESPHEKIRKYWTEEHFLQVILTEIASRFANEKFISILKNKVNTISLQTRKEVANLLSFYSTKDSAALCTMVNLLLHELTECLIWNCKIPCFEFHGNNVDAEMFIALAESHRKVKVKRQTPATDACLRLLVSIYKKTESPPFSWLHRTYRDQVALLINFLSTLGITTTVIVDSLDESAFFFDKADFYLHTLQAFVNSTTNDDILHLALGNWGGGMETVNSFAFYIFIPKIPAAPVNISWTRRDKIPIIELKWDELQLIHYVDYMFDYLRSKARDQCQSLPGICSLLGGQNLCVDTMKQLRHPRDFHIFYSVLTRYMSTVCTQRHPPFNAIQEDLIAVLSETNLRILKE